MEILLDAEKVKKNSWRTVDAQTIANMLEVSIDGTEWAYPTYDEKCPIRKANRKAYDKFNSMLPEHPFTDEKREAWEKWRIMPDGTVLSYTIGFDRKSFHKVTGFLFKHKVSFEVINYDLTQDEEIDAELKANEDSKVWQEKKTRYENLYKSEPEEKEEE
jgi:hypothetical protein